MLSSIATSTLKQYSSALKAWHTFCLDFNKNEFDPSTQDVLHFLNEIKIKGASYGTLNAHRSALSLVSSTKIGEHPLITRFMKGVFRENPTRPKYLATWDVSTVLNKLKEQYPLAELSLQSLSEKLTMLLLLSTGHRLQTISSISINDLKEGPDGFWASVNKILKTTRPGSASTLLYLPKFSESPELCVYSTLKEYLRRTRSLRGNFEELFITTTKPHRPASKDTISRWAKKVLNVSSIDTSIFSTHSTRHASTSLALAKGLDIETIKNTAGWTGNSQVFQKFYNVPILTPDQRNFRHAIISHNSHQ